ncbi:MAG: hypothetical protein ACE5NM_02685 [Sedimentisphaerales bacterium]
MSELIPTRGESRLMDNCFPTGRADALFLPIKLRIRSVLLELIRPFGLTSGCFNKVGVDVFFLLFQLLLREVVAELMLLLWRVVVDFTIDCADGFCLLIKLPIRNVLLELVLLGELIMGLFPLVEILRPIGFGLLEGL